MPKSATPTDKRFKSAFCPFCASDLRFIVSENDHPWGELSMLQCDSCGVLIDICTMSERSIRFETNSREIGDTAVVTVRQVLMTAKLLSDEEEIEKNTDAGKVHCKGCPTWFAPRANAKSSKQTDYCPDCRENGTADELIAEAKKAAKKPAKQTKRKAL